MTLITLLTRQAAAQTEVIKKMHDKYQGKWYKTLTFVQKTTMTRQDGTRDTAIWYESVKGPDLLRIDIGPPSAGNGILYTVDSAVVIRNGAVVRTRPDGNPFLPLIMGVYLQSTATTEAQLTKIGFDLKKSGKGEWQNRDVIIVGAESAFDSTSPQFWIDKERLVLVRMRIGFAPNQPLLDIHAGGYEPVGKGWLATHIEIRSGDKVVQEEQYRDWHADVPLADALFDPKQWSTAGHWVKP
jgi:hypothetical protein